MQSSQWSSEWYPTFKSMKHRNTHSKEKKALTNLDSILKSRDITLPVRAMVFPVVMYGFESWTIKKAESRRIDAFKLRCGRSLLRVPWAARRSK